MVKCSKCGHENQLGRIFCVSCGSKLTLENISIEQIEETFKEPLIKRIWWVIPLLIALLLLTVVVLSLWPKPFKLGQDGTPNDANTVDSYLITIQMIKPGQLVGPFIFLENHINAWLDFRITQRHKDIFMRVSINSGLLTVRMNKILIDTSLLKVRLQLRISYEIICRVQGNRIIVNKSYIGHMPMIGIFKPVPYNKIYQIVSSEKEWKIIPTIVQMEAEPGKFKIWIKK